MDEIAFDSHVPNLVIEGLGNKTGEFLGGAMGGKGIRNHQVLNVATSERIPGVDVLHTTGTVNGVRVAIQQEIRMSTDPAFAQKGERV